MAKLTFQILFVGGDNGIIIDQENKIHGAINFKWSYSDLICTLNCYLLNSNSQFELLHTCKVNDLCELISIWEENVFYKI